MEYSVMFPLRWAHGTGFHSTVTLNVVLFVTHISSGGADGAEISDLSIIILVKNTK